MSPEKPSLRAGIVGAGFAASFHATMLRRVYCAAVELVGVYSPTADHRKRFAGDHGIRAFETPGELIEAVDVVHVCSPAATHEELALTALAAGKWPIVEKPLTGFFGDGTPDFNGERCPKARALEAALASAQRILEAEAAAPTRICYAENWVYAPAVQKEREVIEKTGAQVLRITGEESHSGSHSPFYGYWKHSGGGSLIGKGCHPLTAALYLKRVEGRARDGRPIRPAAVSGRIHAMTRNPAYRDEGHLRTGYHDTEDFSLTHVVFDDGTVADIFASEVVMGGVHNWLEVCANNHRTRCNINPNTSMQTYNPVEAGFSDIYVVEKTGTKQGWSSISPDEDWFTGYQHELEAFYRTIAFGDVLESDSALAADTVATIYSAYVSAEAGGAEQPVEVL